MAIISSSPTGLQEEKLNTNIEKKKKSRISLKKVNLNGHIRGDQR